MDDIIGQQSSIVLDSEFCSSCGCIINTNSESLPAQCKACDHPIDTSEILGKVKKYTIMFKPLDYYSGLRNKKKKVKTGDEDETEEMGQMDQTRICSNPKCGHVGMSYTTMQLRSADEGQTIFYFCPRCKSREVEDS